LLYADRSIRLQPAKNVPAHSFKHKDVEWTGTYTGGGHTFNFYYNTSLHSINWSNAAIDADLPGDFDVSYVSGTYSQDLDDGPALIIDAGGLEMSYSGGTYTVPAVRIPCDLAK